MKINIFSDYALRILIYLASNEGEKATADEISMRFDVSFHHVAKAAQWLTSRGYVNASRGRGGGLILARAPAQVNIGILLRDLEAGSALVDCFKAKGATCRITPECQLKHALAEAHSAFYKSLERYSLDDIAMPSSALTALLKSNA